MSYHASTLLNANWQTLNISKFEYRLLHFFQSFCVPLFSFNVNMEIDRVWRYEVPKLWQNSILVRQAVFLFSALNLWPLVDGGNSLFVESIGNDELSSLLGAQSESEIMEKMIAGASPYFSRTAQGKEGSLFEKTTSYFINSLQNTAQKLADSEQLVASAEQEGLPTFASGMQMAREDELVFKSAELVVSGVLIFSFLGLHPHKLIPLICLDDPLDDGMPQTDLLSICGGIHNTIIASSPSLLDSAFKGMFRDVERRSKLPDDHKSSPIIQKLKDSLTEWIIINHHDELIDSESSEIIEIFKDSIKLMDICFYRMVELNYPIPLFRWILSLDNRFRDILRNKNQLALKILFYYATLCVICRFHLFKHSNIWLDFMIWYKEYNMSSYGGWLYSDDLNLYNFVFEKDLLFELIRFSDIAKLDPDELSSMK